MKIITRLRENIRPEWWMGHCYMDHARREYVMAPIGLHLVIRAWWSLCLRYWRWSWGPCFLDEQIADLLAERNRMAREVSYKTMQLHMVKASSKEYVSKLHDITARVIFTAKIPDTQWVSGEKLLSLRKLYIEMIDLEAGRNLEEEK